MASSETLWNEVARLANKEFFENGQPITGAFLIQLVKYVSEMLLTDEPDSA